MNHYSKEILHEINLIKKHNPSLSSSDCIAIATSSLIAQQLAKVTSAIQETHSGIGAILKKDISESILACAD